MTKTQRQQALVICRAVKAKHKDDRKELAKHLKWYRKNKRPLEF